MTRSQRGAGIAVITLVIGAIIIASLGLFAFEVIRHNTAYDELRSACEAAALAGEAAMASSDSTDPTVTHNNAMTATRNAFRSNTILGFSLNDVNTTAMNRSNFPDYLPPVNKSAIAIEFLNPTSTPPNQPVSDLSSPDGRVVHVFATFTNEPVFGKFLGIPAAPVRTMADGRVPSLDVVMCFDVSSSIDDQTPVTLVRRIWNANRHVNLGSSPDTGSGDLGAVEYQVMTAEAGSPTQGGLCQGRIYDIFHPPAIGTDVDAVPPQHLSRANRGDHGHRYQWSKSMRTLNPDQGSADAQPPGNYPDTDTFGADRFSDLVVNIDGKDVYGGKSITVGASSFDFPDTATLCEAARGNLESQERFESSKANLSLPASVTPRPGYQAAYLAAALAQTQPIGAARQAATDFFQIMNNNTDAHFGFVSFSDGTSIELDKNHGAENSVSASYDEAGTTTVPFRGTELSKTDNKLTDILGLIPSTQAKGCTAMTQALEEAVRQLKKDKGLTRAATKKAIIMFTDGQPTCPEGRGWTTAADEAKTEGITIYTVGLAQNEDVIPLECDHLNAGAGQVIKYKDPTTSANKEYTPSVDGMAAKGATGGRFFLVTNSSDLRYVFENIARHLVQLVKGTQNQL